jgi:hypothetical protein
MDDKPNEPQRWYFTFGVGDPVRLRRNGYVVIIGTADGARKAMLFRFGRQWASQYSEARWVQQDMARYGMTEIDFETGEPRQSWELL